MKDFNRLRSVRHQFVAVGVALSLTGCVFVEDYPNSWPELSRMSGQDCQVLTGLFADKGETGEGQATYLSRGLFPDLSSDLRVGDYGARFTAVRFSWPKPTQLRIQVHDGERVVHEENREASSGFQCTDGVLTLGVTDGTNDGGMVAVEFKNLRLSLVEPYLVAQSTSTGGGIAFLLPIAFHESHYARFPRIEER